MDLGAGLMVGMAAIGALWFWRGRSRRDSIDCAWGRFRCAVGEHFEQLHPETSATTARAAVRLMQSCVTATQKEMLALALMYDTLRERLVTAERERDAARADLVGMTAERDELRTLRERIRTQVNPPLPSERGGG